MDSAHLPQVVSNLAWSLSGAVLASLVFVLRSGLSASYSMVSESESWASYHNADFLVESGAAIYPPPTFAAPALQEIFWW